MQKEVEIKWLDNLAITQSKLPFFAWASKNNEQASQYHTCRDRLTICARAGLHNMNYSSYRTTLMPPMCFDETRLLITAPYEKIQKHFLDTGMAKLLELLHSAEYQMGLDRKTEIFKVSNENCHIKSNGGAYLLVADSLWMRSTPMISMYTLLVRISPAHNLGDHILKTLENCTTSPNSLLSECDTLHVTQSLDGMKRVLRYGEKIWHPTPQENYPSNVSYTAIETSGIKGFTAKTCQIPAAKYWYRDLDVDESKEKTVTEKAA